VTDERPRPAARPAAPGEGIRIGTLLGAPLTVSGWWFVIAALITLFFAPQFRDSRPDLPDGAEYALSATLVVLLYVSVLLHEIGHGVAARAFGIPVVRIRLDVLGGVTEMSRSAGTPGREAVVAGAGPAVSILLGVLGLVGFVAAPDGSLLRLITGQVAVVNLFVSVYNLLPGLPLDGGSLLRSLVWGLTGRRSTATVVAAWSGRVVAVFTAFLPFLLAVWLDTPPSPLSIVWFLVIAASIWAGATATLLQERMRATLTTLTVGGLMRRVTTAWGSEPLSVVAPRVAAAGAAGAVVVDADGRPTGLVSEPAVRATPQERWNEVTTSTVARRIEPGRLVSVDLSGEQLVEHVTAAGFTEYVVVRPDGTAAGLLLLADLDAALAPGAARRGR
jgi:Zn-dependent protease